MPLTKPYQAYLDYRTQGVTSMDLRTRPVTEEEAKKKICPFLSDWCLASTCALWRFKNYGTTGDRVEPTGFCGAGGEPS